MANNGQRNNREKPAVYECAPPEWLPKTSNSADLGFLNFFPPRPSEDEDVLTENTIKHGFTLKNAIPAETYTSKSRQIKELKDGGLIHELEDFMNQVFQRRSDNLALIPPSTFRIPSRTTLNDTKRTAWFDDLANPDVPLSKLSKSIPHGKRGSDLLDLLHEKNVAISRAVWFVRVLGSNDTAGPRNKANYDPLQYSIEWANVMTGYLRKQLLEIALPSAPRPGLNIKQTFKGVLGDPDSRGRWVSKFVYSLNLLRVFYTEFMVDHTTFLSWLVQTLGSCNLAQAGFVVRLADDYLSGMGSCRALVKPFIDGCLSKLQEISNSPSKEALEDLQLRIEDLVRRSFLAAPTSFVSPMMWKNHSETIQTIILGDDAIWHSSNGQSMQTVRLLIQETLLDVGKRNEALLFRTGVQPTKGCLRSKVSDVKLLNSITSTTELSSIPFFETRSENRGSPFSQKLFLLLSWSVCCLQYGDHRPYAAATLLHHWRDKTEERASRRDFASPNELIQDGLFDWLDTDEKAHDERNLSMVALLFGELIQKGLFSYDQYIQRIIARGESGLSFNEEPGSCHRMLLRVIPLYKSDPALVGQRKLALYGVRARTTPEDQIEKDLKNELRELLPEIFKGEEAIMPTSSVPQDSVLRSAARYEQIRVVRQWLMPNVRKLLTKVFSESGENSSLVLRVYCVVIECLDVMKCYRTGLEFTLEVLKLTASTDLLLAIVDNLKRNLNLWVCMDAMATIASALLEAHQTWKSRGVHIRCLANLLLEVDDCKFLGKYLNNLSRQQVIEDAAHFAQALHPSGEAPNIVPSALSEVSGLLQDIDQDAPASLANALWYKYRASANWSYLVWTNVIANLQQVTSIIPDATEQRACALRYAKFLLHVDLHSAEGIDEHVLQWFLGPGLNDVKLLSSESWNVFSTVFLHLAVHGAIRITTLLQGIIYPAWKIGSAMESAGQFEGNRVFLQATTTLCRLLLVEQLFASEEGLPPSDLMEMQRLKTRRREVYRDTNFRLLAEQMPMLVFIEHNEYIEDDFKIQIADLRRTLCCKVDFRLGASRKVGTVVGAFANPLHPELCQENMHESLVSALRLIFNDEERDDQTHVTSLLSPWKLSATAAVTSFVLQQIGLRMGNPSTEAQAKAELAKLASRLMQNATNAEETDFVSEMAKGVSVDVAGAFVNGGLQRIRGILDDIDNSKPEALASLPAKAGHFLNLLSTIMQPFRHMGSPLPSLEQSIQDSLLASLSAKLLALEKAIRDQEEKGREAHNAYTPMTEPVLFLARLLQFDLGFPGAWTQAVKELAKSLLATLLKLTLLHGGGALINPVAFTLLLDTSFYVFDEHPIDSRNSGDLFQHCPSLSSSFLPNSMPLEYRDLIGTIEKHSSICPFTADLVYTTHDADGSIHHGAPVQIRPWEWIESVGDVAPSDTKEVHREERDARYIVKNNTSIPMDMFGARMLGEGVRHFGGKGMDTIAAKGEHLRSLFESDLAAESVYERDWRESRVGFAVRGGTPEGIGSRGEGETGSSHDSTRRRGTPSSNRGSPALSVHTSHGYRSSATAPSSAASSHRTQSPTLSGLGDPMDIDMPLSEVGSIQGKRKASAAGLEDEEGSVPGDIDIKKGKKKSVARESVPAKTSGKTISGKAIKKRK